MRSIHALGLGFALALSVGCGDDTTGTGGGTAATGGSGTGGGAPLEPRSVEVAVRNHAFASLDDVMVLVNHVDGSLAASFLGSELPTDVTVVDGDLVSYVYVTAGDYFEHVDSYRVAPGVQRIEALVTTEATFPTCNAQTMDLTVHIPALPGGVSAAVQSSTGHFAQTTTALPADVTVPVTSCQPLTTFSALVTVRGAVGFEAFELQEDLPFQAGGALELTPTFATEPRSPLTFVVDQLDGATQSWGDAAWYGDHSILDPNLNYLFTPNERDLDQTYTGAAPFTYAPSPMDLPHGYQVGRVEVELAPDATSCQRGATIVRIGATTGPIPFHVLELAEPSGDRTSWSLGEGAIGDNAERVARNDTTYWILHEDPTQPIPAVVFPTFPGVPPGFLAVPTEPTEIVSFGHDDTDATATYADVVAQGTPLPAFTRRGIWRMLTCP